MTICGDCSSPCNTLLMKYEDLLFLISYTQNVKVEMLYDGTGDKYLPWDIHYCNPTTIITGEH